MACEGWNGKGQADQRQIIEQLLRRASTEASLERGSQIWNERCQHATKKNERDTP